MQPEPDNGAPLGVPDLPARRSIIPPPRPRRTTARGAVLELGRLWLRRKLARMAVFGVLFCVLVIKAIYHQAHANDNVGKFLTPSQMATKLPPDACSGFGRPSSAWVEDDSGYAPIFSVTCSGAPSGLVLTVPGQ